MRAVQITRFGGPEVLDVVELPDPEPGPGQQLYDVSTAGVNFADTHHSVSQEAHQGPEVSPRAMWGRADVRVRIPARAWPSWAVPQRAVVSWADEGGRRPPGALSVGPRKATGSGLVLKRAKYVAAELRIVDPAAAHARAPSA
jgi:hypothetical protein